MAQRLVLGIRWRMLPKTPNNNSSMGSGLFS
jgi:hypothetical protein